MTGLISILSVTNYSNHGFYPRLGLPALRNKELAVSMGDLRPQFVPGATVPPIPFYWLV